jgi:hypothetical protein
VDEDDGGEWVSFFQKRSGMKTGWVALVLMVLGTVGFAQATSLAGMNANQRELFADAMRTADASWDPGTRFLLKPKDPHGNAVGRYMVRESSWYALGLLLRDGSGDRAKAAEVLDAVLKEQYVMPGPKWYGTFKRSPEEKEPLESVAWKEYDPNWRVFIGTTFEMILTEYPNRLPDGLAKRMYRSIDVALEGEQHDARLVPSYSNIALMYGALWDFAAVHDHRADWAAGAAAWTESVYALFKQHDAFNEYNSPTYYGVDLFGLALWRRYGSTARMKEMGGEMEARLWDDIADFYQPRLRNISGPYDRSYGMDMESYVAVTGVWIRTVLPPGHAPLPKIELTTEHLGDAWYAPLFVILGTKIPSAALRKMESFEGSHLVRRQITDKRVATAWIGENVIFGGEVTGKTMAAGPTSQFHPATVQWRTPAGEIGWVQLVECPAVDVVADKDGLTIATSGTVRFRVRAEGATQAMMRRDQWMLPGRSISIRTDATGFKSERMGDALEVEYTGVTRMRMSIER